MFRIESIIQLKDEENIEAMIRRHLAALVPSLFVAMIFIVLPFFFLFPLFSLGPVGVIVFGVSIMIGILWAIRSLFLWNADVLVVTNLRIVDVDQKGLLSRKVSEAPYDVIQDVSWERKGIWQTIFRMGSVSVQTAGSSATIEVEQIPHPSKLHEIINDERLRFTNEPKEKVKATPEIKDRRSRIRRIAQLLEEVSDSSVAEIESVLERKVKSSSMEKLFSENTKNRADDEEDSEEVEDDE